MIKHFKVAYPIQLDVGMLRGRKPKGIDFNVAEGRRLIRLDLGAHLPYDLVQRCGLARARHACHVQTLP